MEKLRESLKVYIDELYKVNWPKIEKLQNDTIVVLVASFIIAIVIGLMDFAFNMSLGFIYGLIQ